MFVRCLSHQYTNIHQHFTNAFSKYVHTCIWMSVYMCVAISENQQKMSFGRLFLSLLIVTATVSDIFNLSAACHMKIVVCSFSLVVVVTACCCCNVVVTVTVTVWDVVFSFLFLLVSGRIEGYMHDILANMHIHVFKCTCMYGIVDPFKH